MDFIEKKEFDGLSALRSNKQKYLELFALMCRYNTIVAVKKAGSGHLGSSFSAMDITVYLYLYEMNVLQIGLRSPDRDIYFSSKGHDVPGLYALFYAIGFLTIEQLFKLRRIGGLDGHPDVRINGIESNTGSLGMGISKGKGMVWGKKYQKHKGTVFVLTGDGEFQEGQIYESLQSTAHQKLNDLIVIMDRNKLQTDMYVSDINDIENIDVKVSSFKWHVFRINGHDFKAIENTIAQAKSLTDKPKLIIAETVKGKGVSFMENMEKENMEGKVLYRWHSGAPDDQTFELACRELKAAIGRMTDELKIPTIEYTTLVSDAKPAGSSTPKEYVAEAYGATLVELALNRKDIVVLDGDLSADCRIRGFEKTYPDRFIENGIAEQDMVSMAGGLARTGLLPVVNTFSSFLAARANEQIYNNACEKTKIIYAAHFAGFIPAGPGKSHQSVRDIALFGSIPNMTIIQPCNALETKYAVEYCVETSKENCMLRMNIGPSPSVISLPVDYSFSLGKGTILADGKDIAVFSYGAVLLHEVLEASKMIVNSGVSARVINHPFLNRFDAQWLATAVDSIGTIVVTDDHFINGGFGDLLLSALVEHNLLAGKKFFKLGLKDLPECGTPLEVLKHHRLDAQSIAEFLLQKSSNGPSSVLESSKLSYSEEAPQ